MQNIKEHIIFKTLTFLLVVTLLVPTATKFAHVFTHYKHKHEVCKGEKSTHLHELDLDCEFYKFKLNNNYYSSFDYRGLFYKTSYYKPSFLTYKFRNNHRPLSYSLRGPPVLV